MSETQKAKTHQFQAEVNQVLSLVINSLYSNKEIFLRELVSNASDALDKLRFKAITEPDLMQEDETLRIRLLTDAEAGTLTISDNGVGMTEQELIENLGTIAHSGSKAFIEGLESQKDAKLIGEFGVGFYSAYLVADDVDVVTRAAGVEEAFKWSSDAKGEFTISAAEREGRGTSVVLHLKEEQKELLNDWKLRNLINRYSDFVGHPIEVKVERTVGEGDDATTEVSYESVNKAKALWQRPSQEITDDQYEEFYKHLTHDWEPPLGHTHFKIEGTQLFTGLFFIPKRPPFDLFDQDTRHGVRLYVKRVFIMDDCDDLLPRWLRFMRGVIDSDDLPLNVSRELLQDSSMVRTIRKQVVRKSLDLLEKIAEDRPEDYKEFWGKYGVVLKEGLHAEPKHKNRIGKLLRYETSKDDGLSGLEGYVERMAEDQPAIYYAMGPSKRTVESSPHLEELKKRGYEIIYMTDPIDQWVVQGLSEFEDKPLVSAMATDLKLNESDEDQTDEEKNEEEGLGGLTTRFSNVLDSKVSEVRVSKRLTDSPVCLVIPEGGMHAHIERILRLNNQEMPSQKRIMEINPDHTLINGLKAIHAGSPDSDQVTEWIELLYDQALLAEGSPIDDPGLFAGRMTRLLERAIAN
jgi:molecular chaperone HtpG